MDLQNLDLKMLMKMGHSPIYDYVVPGLTSLILGGMPCDNGCVRLFVASRDQIAPVTPHTHRYDLQCIVLRGEVENILWTEVGYSSRQHDKYMVRTIEYSGAIGSYHGPGIEDRQSWWQRMSSHYTEGMCYQMKSTEMHSIYFSRDAVVLIHEGPMVSKETKVLLPVSSQGATIDTLKVEPWMFAKPSV